MIETLPHGPHGLSAEEVAASQVARLRSAILAEVARQGYPSTTITAVVRRARVSPNVFYKHYRDKQACLRDALQAAADVVTTLPVVRPGSTPDLAAQLVRPYLDLVESQPDAARALMVEIDAAGPELRRRRRQLFGVAAGRLREAHERVHAPTPAQAADPARDQIYLAILHAGHGLIRDWLEETPDRPVAELAPTLIGVVSTLLLGAEDE